MQKNENDEDIKTYWDKCTYTGDIPPWELKLIPGKGYAAFATRKFEIGDLICTELPVIWVPYHHPFTKEQQKEIEINVNKLNVNDKNAFLELANVFNSDNLSITDEEYVNISSGIFMTNCFDMANTIYAGEACGMYCAIARLNHSCTPNTIQTHIPQSMEEILVASRTIEIGEELNDSYIDLRESRIERNISLKKWWRFECDCKSCFIPPSNESNYETNNIIIKTMEEDDQLRCKSMKLDHDIITAAEFNQQRALSLAIELIDLLENKKCINWSIRYLSESYISVYHICMALNKKNKAFEYLEKAHNINLKLQGCNSPETIRTKELLLARPTAIDVMYKYNISNKNS